MKTKRTYHGWIYIEKEKGLKDNFSVQYKDEKTGESVSKFVGYGNDGANKAVDFFEKTKNLGHVNLEQTPLGLRVFTEVEVE